MLGIPHCKLAGLTPARYRSSRLSVFLEKRMAWDTIHHRKSAYISMMKEMTECAGGISSLDQQSAAYLPLVNCRPVDDCPTGHPLVRIYTYGILQGKT